MDRQRCWAPPFFVLVLASSIVLAVTQPPLWWLAVPLPMTLLAFQLVLPRRMERQLDVLRAA